MKLKNKRTGEIMEFDAILPVKDVSGDSVAHLEYNSLTEFNEEWEDVPEEPKEYWYIDYDGGILCGETDESSAGKMMINMGNHFGTLKEAEKAVEKLKAWKRLKNKGFRFLGYYRRLGETKSKGEIGFETDDYEGIKQDLDLLFGGEE